MGRGSRMIEINKRKYSFPKILTYGFLLVIAVNGFGFMAFAVMMSLMIRRRVRMLPRLLTQGT